jgi:hypothetical protein
VGFLTFSLPEHRCVRLLLKNLGKRMPEAEIREELEALHINVQAVMQPRSKQWDQVPEKDRPLTPHFIVSVARIPDVANLRSLTDLCGLRVKVETYNAPKGLCNANAASALDTRSATAAMHLGVWPAVTSTNLGSV